MTVNIDLCFVPATHALAQKLPAVSGSSGRLVVERPRSSNAHSWPGLALALSEHSYSEAMQTFALLAQQRCQQGRYPTAPSPKRLRCTSPQQVALEELRAARRLVRQQRQQQDQAWSLLTFQHREASKARRSTGGSTALTSLVEQREWKALRHQRQVTLAKRRTEDEQWRAARAALQASLPEAASKIPWRAILLITDNCTRQCAELPLFASGGRVSAEEVVAALQRVLPATLQFIISDQGTHFTSKAFQSFAQRAGFVAVPIARHRPESNGIAERCVRTLKEWLASLSWASDAELQAHLTAFRTHYNERPHQGLGIPGLSPNEFARRIWLL